MGLIKSKVEQESMPKDEVKPEEQANVTPIVSHGKTQVYIIRQSVLSTVLTSPAFNDGTMTLKLEDKKLKAKEWAEFFEIWVTR